MNASVLNSEKILLAREILNISDINVLQEVKRRLLGVLNKGTKSNDNTMAVLNAVTGKWKDSRDAESMVET